MNSRASCTPLFPGAPLVRENQRIVESVSNMKAMVLRGPRELGLAEVERPALGHNQVLVRVTHSGVCGTDLHIYEGAIPVRHPLIMGHEMIGEVVEGGDDTLRRGDRVIVDPAIYCGMCLNC